MIIDRTFTSLIYYYCYLPAAANATKKYNWNKNWLPSVNMQIVSVTDECRK